MEFVSKAYGCTDCDEDDGTPIANNCQPNFLLANTDDGSAIFWLYGPTC